MSDATDWYAEHDHGQGKHSHSIHHGGHGVHLGTALVTREEALSAPVLSRGERGRRQSTPDGVKYRALIVVLVVAAGIYIAAETVSEVIRAVRESL